MDYDDNTHIDWKTLEATPFDGNSDYHQHVFNHLCSCTQCDPNHVLDIYYDSLSFRAGFSSMCYFILGFQRFPTVDINRIKRFAFRCQSPTIIAEYTRLFSKVDVLNIMHSWEKKKAGSDLERFTMSQINARQVKYPLDQFIIRALTLVKYRSHIPKTVSELEAQMLVEEVMQA